MFVFVSGKASCSPATRSHPCDSLSLVVRVDSYTNMTKVLFLTLWYCSIYPGAFFLGGCTLYLNYLADRFSLMRTWKRPPQLGSTVSKVSRRYFFNLAIVAMAVMSSFYWSGFPYDNLCPAIEGGGQSVVEPGNYNIRFRGNSTTTTVEVVDGTPYRFCNQNLLKPGGRLTFPFIAAMQPEGGEWMTEDQEFVTTIYGISSMGVIAIVIAMFCFGWIQECISLFTTSYSVSIFLV
jgi:hypothetical protein